MITEAYRIYTTYNAADTTRDPDEIYTTDICYRSTRKGAMKRIRAYIDAHFFRPDDVVISEYEGGLRATNFVSYGETIIAEKITIDAEEM